MNSLLFRHFENNLEVGEHKLQWTTRGEDLVLRPVEADESVVWFILGRADIGRTLLHPPRNLAKRDDDICKLEQAICGRQFWRYWQLPSGEDCFLRKNHGLFQTRYGELVCFDLLCAFVNFANAHGEEIEQFLKELDVPESDLQAAKAWSKLPKRERVWEMLPLQGGSHDEFFELVQASLVLCGQQNISFSLQADVPGRILLKREYDCWNRRQAGQEHLKGFFDVLDRYFHLQRTTGDWRGHDNFGDPMDVPLRVFTSTEPTQHERLEALLFWRDFLRGKIPDAEIESLLKPIST